MPGGRRPSMTINVEIPHGHSPCVEKLSLRQELSTSRPAVPIVVVACAAWVMGRAWGLGFAVRTRCREPPHGT